MAKNKECIVLDKDRLTVTLVYLSVNLGIDLEKLAFLYERYGKDTFLFFHMLAGHQVRIPSVKSLTSALEASKEICEGRIPESRKGERAYEALKAFEKDGRLVVPLTITEKPDGKC